MTPDETAATNPNTPPTPPPPQAMDSSSAAAPTPSPAPAAAPATAPATAPAAGATQQPQQQDQPDPPQVPQQSLAVKVYHGIMGALGGTQDTSYTRDPQTGKMVVSQVAATPGSQWKRIIAGVVQGTAAGLGAEPGPGQLERAAGMGMSASMQGAQQIEQQKQDNANQDFDAQQKATLNKAQTQAATYEGAVNAFHLSRMQVQAHVEDTQRENDFVKLVNNGGDGSQDLGVAKDFAGIIQMHKDMPGLLAQNAQGNIIQTAHVNADGQFDGTRFALVTPEWKDQKLDKDQNFYFLQPPTEIGKPATIAKQTVKAGTMSNGDFALRQSASSNEILKWQADNQKQQHQNAMDASTINKNNAEAGQAQTGSVKNLAEAGKANAEATAANEKTGDSTNGALIDAIYSGHVTMSRLDYLASKNPALLEAVTQKHPDFDSSKAAAYPGVYKEFTSSKPNTAGGQLNAGATALGHLLELSQINTVWSHIPGTPAYTAYMNKVDTVATELAKFYGDATVPAIASLKSTLASTLPGSRQAAITTQVQSMGDKFDSYQQTWDNAAPSKAYEAPMPGISKKAIEARAALDPAYRSRIVQQQSPISAAPPAPSGMVTVQIQGMPPGHIPAANVAQFKKDHPNATVSQ